jgi:hypothetical protein
MSITIDVVQERERHHKERWRLPRPNRKRDDPENNHPLLHSDLGKHVGSRPPTMTILFLEIMEKGAFLGS